MFTEGRLGRVGLQVRLDDDLLEAEDVRVVRRDRRLHPLNVVARVAGALVVAGRLDPREPFDRVAVPVEERLVDAEVVRIAVTSTTSLAKSMISARRARRNWS